MKFLAKWSFMEYFLLAPSLLLTSLQATADDDLFAMQQVNQGENQKTPEEIQGIE